MKRKLNQFITLVFIITNVSFVLGQPNNLDQKFKYPTGEDSLAFAFATNLVKEMQSRNIPYINYDRLIQAIKEGLSGKPSLLTSEQAKEVIGRHFRTKYIENLKEGEAFLYSNSSKPNVVMLPSGLQYTILKRGEGRNATLNDTLTIHYIGSFVNGKQFDNSYNNKMPIVGTPGSYIKGWQEGLLLMNVGSRFRFFIPPKLAYADRELGEEMPPYSTLIFDVELIKIGVD